MMKPFQVAPAVFLFVGAATAQTITPGQTVIPMGQCQIPSASLTSAVSFGSCQGASTTATCSGTTLTAASTSGQFKIGQTLSGTGITAGTTVQAFGTSTGGNGTITVSQSCTSSSNTVTGSGIPSDMQGHTPTMAVLYAETANVRFRDDGGVPTASIGMEITSGSPPFSYVGTMTAAQFIAASGSPILDVAFYRTSSP
jgi:hypothetical protein